ncbi:MAG TPA: acyl carrier protein [Polyangiaceae bacterium]
MIIDKVREFLIQQFFRGEAVEALELDQSLVSSGLLDSVATLKLVLFLEQEFEICIESSDIVNGELDTLASMEALVSRKCQG